MMRTAAVIAMTIYLVGLAWLVNECLFLRPATELLWREYAEGFAYCSILVVLNVTAVAYGCLRKLYLKDAGGKLSHLEKQLRGRTTLSEELTARLTERK